MYSAQVLDHFQNPRGAGELDGATVTVEVQNPACGDVLRLSVRIVDGCVYEARFKAMGCVPSIACGSRLVEMITGMEVARLPEVRREQLVEDLGGLPEASQHAGYLAMDAVKAALRSLHASPSPRQSEGAD